MRFILRNFLNMLFVILFNSLVIMSLLGQTKVGIDMAVGYVFATSYMAIIHSYGLYELFEAGKLYVPLEDIVR